MQFNMTHPGSSTHAYSGILEIRALVQVQGTGNRISISRSVVKENPCGNTGSARCIEVTFRSWEPVVRDEWCRPENKETMNLLYGIRKKRAVWVALLIGEKSY